LALAPAPGLLEADPAAHAPRTESAAKTETIARARLNMRIASPVDGVAERRL